MKISDNTSVAMPMRNLITIIGAVGVGVWAYFGVIERLNQLETSKEITERHIESQVNELIMTLLV